MRSPRLVKIWTTPFAASEPYKDEAAAPFTTSTRSMSSELMSERPCRVIVPSTMISGPGTSVEAHVAPPQADGDVSEVAERSRIVGSPPGAPLPDSSRAPATLPSSAPSAETPGAWFSVWASTWPTAKVSFFASVASATPVTTTASSVIGSNLSSKSWVWRSEEHTSELQSRLHLVCRLLLEKKKKKKKKHNKRKELHIRARIDKN